MKNNTHKRLFLAATIILIALFHISALNINFDRITNNDGLSSDQISEIIQDSEGFIWFGTYAGLNCYTGTDFKIYKPNRDNEPTFSSAEIKCLCNVPGNQIWIGTRNKGIDIFDRQTKQIITLNTSSEDIPLLSNNIGDITLDSKGQVWIGTQNGITVYNTKNKNTKHYLSGKKKKYVTVIYEDSRGNIFAGTWRGSLFLLDKEEDQFKAIKLIENNNPKNIKSLFEDRDGNLWVGTWGSGLYKTRISQGKASSGAHIEIKNKHYSPDHTFQFVYDIDQDKHGRLWLGTDVGLGYILAPNESHNELRWIAPGNGKNNLNSKDISTLFIDAANTIWIGTQGNGVSKIDFNTTTFTTYKSHSDITEYSPNTFCSFWYIDEELYTGSYALGFGKYDIKTRKFTEYKDLPLFSGINEAGIKLNAIISCTQVDDRYLWMQTRYQGIIIYDLQERKAQHLRLKGIQGKLTSFLHEGDKIWMSKPKELILLTPDPSSEDKTFPYKRTRYHYQKDNPDGISSQEISYIIRDKKNRLWISFLDGSIDEVIENENPEQTTFINYCPATEEQLSVQTMYEDSHENLWLGTTEKGLWLFKKDENRFVNFNDITGISGDMVFSIIEDNNFKLWISTNMGISCIDLLNINGSYVTNYNSDDGLQGNIFVLNAVGKSEKGELMFGGYHGFNFFAPQQTKHNTYIPPLAFTSFEIDRTPIQIPYAEGTPLTIGHKNTSFLIEFTALSYTKSSNNHYQYKLDGYDKQWVNAKKGFNNAVYGKIPAGNYTFMVKGSNNHGIWNNKPLSIAVQVKKSPFKTLLAYLIYALIFVSALWAYIYYTMRNFKLQQAFKDEQNERLRIEKINQFKLKFFTNISHELLTPLSIISNAVEQYIDNKPSKKKDLAIVQRNTNRLTRLINQLLDFRKIESSNRKLMVEKSEVNVFISSLTDNFLPLCKEKYITFEVKGQVTGEIYIDIDKLDKALHNILSNAFKHTPENGIISLEYGTHFSNNIEYLSMSVQNSGNSIPEDLLDQIFDRFYRIDDRKHESGAGIGLAYTKALINLHKGTIEANNVSEGGVIFSFEVPVSETQYTEEERASTSKEPSQFKNSFSIEMDEKGGIKKKTSKSNKNIEGLPRILLVEDNNDMRSIIRKYLSKDFDIYESTNGIEGLEVLCIHNIELIISDIMMPKMDGLTFCRKVKTNVTTSHIPIILTTAKRTQENFIEGYEARADSYVTKPVNLQLLMVRITNLLEQRKNLHSIFSKGQTPDTKNFKINNIDQELLDKINQHIKENICNTDLKVLALAKHVGLSNSVLYRKIKSYSGLSPVEYIRSRRLNYGAELLRKGLNSSEATYECGFGDPSYFGSCFKKQFGVTPKKFIENL